MKGKLKITLLISKLSDHVDLEGIELLEEMLKELKNVQDHEPRRSTNTV